MMDLPLVAQAMLVYAVLGAGVLATLLTGFVQLRSLFGAWRLGANAAMVRRGFLAASVGMGSVGGSIVALEVGGPGAIGWMWIASLLGMALVYADVLFAVRFRRRDEHGVRAATVFALADGLPRRFGIPLAYVFALVFVTFALAAGSMLQTQQSSTLLETLGGGRWLVAGFLVGATAIGMAAPKLRAFVAALGPVAVVLYVIATVWVLGKAPVGVGEAFAKIFAGMSTGEGSTLAGGATGLLVALQVGFLRATMATEAGLGSAGFTREADHAKHAEDSASAAMLAPLISGIVVPTFTALVVLCSTPWTGQRLDEPVERIPAVDERPANDDELADLAARLTDGDPSRLLESDHLRVAPLWAPLEQPMSRGTAASLQAGQTIVLPIDLVAGEDATSETEALLVDHVYPMVMRASPRGVKAPISETGNEILLNFAEESEMIREVVFRDRDPELAPYAAYDVRVPVLNERIGTDEHPAVRLRPVDPEFDLRKMSTRRDGPYVVFGDFHFQARVVQMFHTRWGIHHAVIEAEPDPTRPLSLRLTVSTPGFRGPYLDAGEPRPPLAMLAREDFDAPIGARMAMEMRAPTRGVAIGKLSGAELRTPPWGFLAETKRAVLRHKTDPSLDVVIPVTSELRDGTLRFVSGNRKVADFAKADRWAEFENRVYLLPPAYEFQVEVHSALRFPASSSYLDRLGLEREAFESPFMDRRTLVAVHDHDEPQGSRNELYDPHPAEVAPFMDGPYVAGSGIERLAWASRISIERGADLLLAISVLILALTTMIAWSDYGARASDFAFGHGAGLGFRLVFLAAGLFGAGLSLTPILNLTDATMVGLVLLHGVGLIALLVRHRASPAAKM